MKLLHIADLHLGKRVYEYPMLEDQRAILNEILEIARAQEVSAVLIAGDVYDRPVPPQEAVNLLSDFLYALSKENITVCMIAGNHDSAERLDFCAELLRPQGVHIAPPCKGAPTRVLLEDSFGHLAVHMISYARPAALRPFLGEAARSAQSALSAMIEKIDFSDAARHILLCHDFVTGGSPSESELTTVGTLETVSASVFAPFDYVAMGHLHRPQTIAQKIRYAGSPLAYSFSEAQAPKSVTLVEVTDEVCYRTLPLHPVHAMREVRGTLGELLAMEYSEDYIRAVVTDEDVPPDARVTVRTVFPNLMRFAVENSHTLYEEDAGEAEHVESRAPLELFAEFYEKQCGTAPDEARLAVMREIFAQRRERE